MLKVKEKSLPTRSLSSQVVLGGGVVLVGVLLLLDQFNIASFGSLFQFVPSFFILLGVWQLVKNGFRYWTGPFIMVAIMTMLQLSILDIVDGNMVWRLWPLVLIAVGASILLRQRNGGESHVFSGGEGYHSAETFDIFAMFGGADRKMTSQDFQGGSVTAIFGAAELNLHEMQVEQRPAVINVFTIFGGVSIKASPDTLIDNRIVAIFGGSGDDRKQRKRLAGESAEIIIKGFAMFGGVGIEE